MKRLPLHLLRAGGAEVFYMWVATRSGLQRVLHGIEWAGRPFAAGLAETVLDPFLARWNEPIGDERHQLAAVTDAAMGQCLEAFAAVRGSGRDLSEEAVLAALALTANLQRTVIRIAERLARPALVTDTVSEPLRLSRDWCGLVPDRDKATGEADRAVARALGCGADDVARRCDEALSNLRGDLRGGELLAREDWENYANRSGVVRERNSSM